MTANFTASLYCGAGEQLRERRLSSAPHCARRMTLGHAIAADAELAGTCCAGECTVRSSTFAADPDASVTRTSLSPCTHSGSVAFFLATCAASFVPGSGPVSTASSGVGTDQCPEESRVDTVNCAFGSDRKSTRL